MDKKLIANLQLIYVSDMERSKAFYNYLLNTTPVFETPRYVAYGVDGQALFALWTGGATPQIDTPRYHEIGIMLPSGKDVDELFELWSNKPQVKILQEPQTEIFGRTFLVADPDGHVIRICPLD
ncbi:VOC family protein [Aeromonas dhakensis]|uniref:VOC family protein n=1 Tax=Aeromonas dhakensis TaxID=196024 RepID=UPI001BCD3DF9|nr:VOC family protein [Aeromonas dhakensis]MBS4718240.1 VOC family protein [Aeromonas dhakensis]MDX7698168.1 VOC family protein [Aeromonas dhakensis]HDZ8879035.1 VOC family protein [Aeromonas dhakensis]